MVQAPLNGYGKIGDVDMDDVSIHGLLIR